MLILEHSAPAPGVSALKGETLIEEPSRLGRSIARRTAETRATVPDLELVLDVQADACLELARERGCSLTAVLVRACAVALSEVPRANAAYREGRFELYSRVNIGVIIQTDDGYLTPTVLDADLKTLEQLSAELVRVRDRARAGQLTPPELAGATFTFSDLGEYGVQRSSAFVNPPQAAALTAGSIRAVALVHDGQVVAGHAIGLTLACDHRILFGARAAGFLRRIAELLEAREL
jgi:pyruvate dehydrogenase E2 component (dihydrolipoamide acetyltransferase)